MYLWSVSSSLFYAKSSEPEWRVIGEKQARFATSLAQVQLHAAESVEHSKADMRRDNSFRNTIMHQHHLQRTRELQAQVQPSRQERIYRKHAASVCVFESGQCKFEVRTECQHCQPVSLA